ncbi:TATA box-binding protein-associated factor RNA polymerase I subunit C [Mortierella sp. NVP85]|nr:TATA box-binding protein-associated factor RNA polymerase I subunit C [Mortierella sp. NVP85]
MLPRERQWEPKEVMQYDSEFTLAWANTQQANAHARYMESEFPSSGANDDVRTLAQLLSEDHNQEHDLSFYNPFMGNLCAVGQFFGLPIVATPSGPGASQLAITIAAHRPLQEPCFNLLAPKSTLIAPLSPIYQIATLPMNSGMGEFEEQVLVRTRESVSIVTPSLKVPLAISRIKPEYVRVAAQVSSLIDPSSTEKTIHASISPYSPNTYLLLGDKGRIAFWTPSIVTPTTIADDDSVSDSDSYDTEYNGRGRSGIQDGQSWSSRYQPPVQTPKVGDPRLHRDITVKVTGKSSVDDNPDPWRRSSWGPHPSQVIVASRDSLNLYDFRGPTVQSIFNLRGDETIQAIQEDNRLQLAPFQTYIATSRQIACIDQRFPKRPVISWAHQMGREMPCGIKVMDMVLDGSNWSNSTEPESVTLRGQVLELPSLHSHSQYVNTHALRDPQTSWKYQFRGDGLPQQAIKPPLMGFAVLPTKALEDVDMADQTRGFTLLHYSFTGAVYAQDMEMKTKREVESADSLLKDTIHSTEIGRYSGMDAASGNHLSSKVASSLIKNGIQDDKVIDTLIEAANSNVASWGHEFLEIQEEVDESVVQVGEVMPHIDQDLKRLLGALKQSLVEERKHGEDADLDDMVEKATVFIRDNALPVTMYDIFEAIDCNHWAVDRRTILAHMIQESVETHSSEPNESGKVIHYQVSNVWPRMGRKIDALFQDGEPTIDAIMAYLEDLYPLPEKVVLQQSEDEGQQPSIANQLASLSIPGDQAVLHPVETSVDPDRIEGQEWPTQESRLIRSNTLRRLAHELVFSSTFVTKTMEEVEATATPSSQTIDMEMTPTTLVEEATGPTDEFFTLHRLFQRQKGEKKKATAETPKIQLSTRIKRVVDDWEIGDNPADYDYRLPPLAMLELSDVDEDEVMEKKARTQDKQMKKLRRRREEREKKARLARKAEENFLNTGSTSQPVPSSSVMFDDEADEDGIFSLPTVISASQPALSLKTRPSSSSSSSSKPTKPIKSHGTTQPKKQQTLSLSQPNVSTKEDAIMSTQFVDNSEWEATLLLEEDMGTSSQTFTIDQSFNQSQEFSEEFSQELGSQDFGQSQDTGFMWGASQPVRGAFATKVKPKSADNKGKKKKSWSQGF